MNFLKFVRVRAKFTENNLSSKASQVALVVKNLPAKAGDVRDVGLTNQSWEDPLEEGIATQILQNSCLENPMDRRAWYSTVCRVT